MDKRRRISQDIGDAHLRLILAQANGASQPGERAELDLEIRARPPQAHPVESAGEGALRCRRGRFRWINQQEWEGKLLHN